MGATRESRWPSSELVEKLSRTASTSTQRSTASDMAIHAITNHRERKSEVQEARAPDPALIASLSKLKAKKQTLELELEMLKADYANQRNKNISDYEWNGLPAEFGFGKRYYQCMIPPPGVGYRNTPSFADKNPNGTGPEGPQVIEADAIVQGPAACFVRCTSGRGWLPLTDPTGNKQCFKHLGKTSDINLSAMGYKLNKGNDKL